MSDIRRETVGPVIQEDFAITSVSEWDGALALER